jgi:ADP-glucose pyrophosphorylase
MKDYYATSTIACPSITTILSEDEFKNRAFKVISLSNDRNISAFAEKTNTLLKHGSSNEDDLAIFLVDSKTLSLYYDSSSNDVGKSNKMACLIYKNLLSKDAGLNVKYESYSDILGDNSAFVSAKSEYYYWIVIGLKSDSSSDDLMREAINSAIKEYYGVN